MDQDNKALIAGLNPDKLRPAIAQILAIAGFVTKMTPTKIDDVTLDFLQFVASSNEFASLLELFRSKSAAGTLPSFAAGPMSELEAKAFVMKAAAAASAGPKLTQESAEKILKQAAPNA